MSAVAGVAAAVAVAPPPAAAQTAEPRCPRADRGSQPFREAARRCRNREQPKIVGGRLAPDGAFPWQVSVSARESDNAAYAHFCGGSVYSRLWIVTAAHCVDGNLASDLVVIAGTHKLGKGGQVRDVKRIVIRSDYVSSTKSNDVALLELESPLSLNSAVQPIRLVDAAEESGVLQSGGLLTVVGWGATQEDSAIVRDLRYVEVPPVSRQQCNRKFAYDGAVDETMLCAGFRAGQHDACQGDSGGPLSSRTTGAPLLMGIVSWGEGCARTNKVGVYTRVSGYARWVSECVAKSDSC